jgi:hypothetical protein
MTIDDIRKKFGAGTIETWLDREGFSTLEEAVGQFGEDYVDTEIEAYLFHDPADCVLETCEVSMPVFGEEDY